MYFLTLCLFITVALLYCTTTPFTASVVLIAMLCEMLAVMRWPKALFEKRLNDFFIVIHYPFCKWNRIFESSNKEGHLQTTGFSNCREFYRVFSSKLLSVYDFIDTEHGYYRMITHLVIINHLKKYDKDSKIQILTCQPAYQNDLVHIQKSLFFNRCKKCRDADRCKFKKMSAQPRQFYYIEFYIP